jgi:hypothetical protein
MNHLHKPALALFLLVLPAIIVSGCGGSAARAASAVSGSPSPSPDPGSSSGSSSTQANGITVSSPASGGTVGSPFKLAASATNCSQQSVTSIGYSLDDSASTSAVNGAAISTEVPAPAGTHTLHVKSWGASGASCNTDITVSVAGSAAPESIIPSDAKQISNIQNLNGWQASHDPGAGANSSGTMRMVGSPSMSGHARRFATSFSNSGGEIYNIAFDNDPDASNFFYDGWIYLDNSAGNIQNLEMDLNQVLRNGHTIIYGFQCDGNSGTWDYTTNQGSIGKPVDAWIHSHAACNMRSWGRNAWHHVQISYSRDNGGKVTYHSVWLDGNESQIEATVPSEFALGWTQALLTNFQIDGLGSGSNTSYLDKLTISRW